MTVLKKAIIRAYSSATHKASVQVAGSLAVWLDGVPVATDIPAADVAAGRECSVLFFDDTNPTDAVVISIQGANPSVPPGSLPAYQTIQDESVSLTQRSLLDFRGGLVRAVDNAGGPATDVHVGKQPDGTDLFATADLSPHLIIGKAAGLTKLLNDAWITRHATIGPQSVAPNVNDILLLLEEKSGTLNALNAEARQTGDSQTIGVIGKSIALTGNPNAIPTLKGLQFIIEHQGTGLVTDAVACTVSHSGSGPRTNADFFKTEGTIGGSAVNSVGFRHSANYNAVTTIARGFAFQGAHTSGTLPTLAAFDFAPGLMLGTMTDVYAFRILSIPGGTNRYGFYCANIAGGIIRRLLELLGATTANLRVEAGDPTNPGANLGRSQALAAFNENGVITLRRIEWKDQANLIAGDKVLVAV